MELNVKKKHIYIFIHIVSFTNITITRILLNFLNDDTESHRAWVTSVVVSYNKFD